MSTISSDLDIQKGLQEKYLSDERGIDTVLSAFSKALSSKDPLATLKKSDKGSTGFTCFCSLPSYSIDNEDELQPIGFILKWQNLAFSIIEDFGANVFKHFGMTPPKNTNIGSL